MGKRRSREQWAGIIGALEATGESEERFCAKRGISLRTLRWWRWRLGSTRAVVGADRVRLLPVQVTAPTSGELAHGSIVVSVAGVDLRFEVGTEVGYVADIVAAVRARG